MDNRTWFEKKDFLVLRITQHTNISNPHVEKTLLIEDTAVVKHFVEVIEAIPPNGDMMISFGPGAEHIELSFEDGTYAEKINFYQKKIKTPSTGFNSVKSKEEQELYREIEALLKTVSR
ncbi:MAG: hypothetical protein ACTHJT_07970 [Cytophaga sp.]|uniref:hypothetical protein n=1 Tax=Cytophaga sp. TaxID=29535 RepID=UPI003F80C206